MEPFYFDSQNDRLFGSYHPAGNATFQRAILICPPIYSEYFRTYRYLRNLADAWASAGYHVMRFDYYGTGDSDGEWQDAGPKRWVEDVVSAASELRSISGCTEVSLFGIRFGGLIALRSCERQIGVNRVSLWDPILSGASYIDSLRNTHRRLLAKSNIEFRAELSKLPDELAGFKIPGWLHPELEKTGIDDLDWSCIADLKLYVSDSGLIEQPFVELSKEHGLDVQTTVFNDNCDWASPSESALQAANVFGGLRQCQP